MISLRKLSRINADVQLFHTGIQFLNKKLLIICLVSLLSACGSKGDLFIESSKESPQQADPVEVKEKDDNPIEQQDTKLNGPEPINL